MVEVGRLRSDLPSLQTTSRVALAEEQVRVPGLVSPIAKLTDKSHPTSRTKAVIRGKPDACIAMRFVVLISRESISPKLGGRYQAVAKPAICAASVVLLWSQLGSQYQHLSRHALCLLQAG